MLCCVALCYVMLCCVVLCCVVLCCVVLCYVVLCCVVLCCVVLFCVMLCCSHYSYSYIEYTTQQMNSEHTVKRKYPGADICSSFVLVMAGFFDLAHLWPFVLKCIGRVLGVQYSGGAAGWDTVLQVQYSGRYTVLQAGRSRIVIGIS